MIAAAAASRIAGESSTEFLRVPRFGLCEGTCGFLVRIFTRNEILEELFVEVGDINIFVFVRAEGHNEIAEVLQKTFIVELNCFIFR